LALVLPQEVEVGLRGRTIRYYEEKGYEIPRRLDKRNRFHIPKDAKIMVDVLDLSEYSNIQVNFICDYCGKEYTQTFDSYSNKNKNGIIHKDCCVDCIVLKREESNMLRYGVNIPTKLKSVSDKISKTFEEKYNGIGYFLHTEEINKKRLMSLYRNGTAPLSRGQQYISNVLGGELNYLQSYFFLDIAFLEDKIYIEYDGGGHNLLVQRGYQTEQEFKNKEIKRSYALNNKGWKEIRIISLKDNLPSKEIIIDIYKYAIKYLNTGHSWIKFDIDNGLIITSQFHNEFDYGKLKRVTYIKFEEELENSSSSV